MTRKRLRMLGCMLAFVAVLGVSGAPTQVKADTEESIAAEDTAGSAGEEATEDTAGSAGEEATEDTGTDASEETGDDVAEAAVFIKKDDKDWWKENKLSSYDADGDGKLSVSEAKKVKALKLKEKSDAEKLKYFPNLKTLVCDGCLLTKLDVSKNSKLTGLNCYDNKLTKLDVSKNSKLTGLNCGSNKLTKLDVSNLKSLEEIYYDPSVKIIGAPSWFYEEGEG